MKIAKSRVQKNSACNYGGMINWLRVKVKFEKLVGAGIRITFCFHGDTLY